MTWNGPWARRGLTAAILVGGMVLLGSSASADQGSALDEITTTYRNATLSWQSSLLAHAKALFALLAGIEVIYSMCRLVVRGGELQDFVYELFQQIMYIGFFGWLLTNYSTFTGYIIQSFEQAGATASQSAGGAGGLTPGDTFSAGLQVCTLILQIPAGPGGLDALAEVPTKIGLLLLAVVILICFVLIAAEQILTLVESYIVVAAGMLMMGFGGSRWTKDYAIKTFGYSLSVGAKLMILNLVIGLGLTLIKQWAGSINSSSTLQSAFVMLGQAVVMLALTKSIPQMVHGLVSGGIGHGSGAMDRAAGQIAAAVGGAVATAVGVGMATSAASSLASEQLKNSDDNGASPKGGLSQMLGHIGKTAQNLGDGSAEDIGNRLSGKPGANSGVMGGRIAANLSHQLQQLGAAAKKPAAPSGSGDETEAAGAAEATQGSGKLEGELARDNSQAAAAGQDTGADAPGDPEAEGHSPSDAPAAALGSDAVGTEAVIDGAVAARTAPIGVPTTGMGAGDASAGSPSGLSSPGALLGTGGGSGGRGVSETSLGLGEGAAIGAPATAAVATGQAAAIDAVLIDGGVKGAGWTGLDGEAADASGAPVCDDAIAGLEVGRFGSSGLDVSSQGSSPQSIAAGLGSEATLRTAAQGLSASGFGAQGFRVQESGTQILGRAAQGLAAGGTERAPASLDFAAAPQGGASDPEGEPFGHGGTADADLRAGAGPEVSGLAVTGGGGDANRIGPSHLVRSVADAGGLSGGIRSILADTPAPATPAADANESSLAEDARADAASLASEMTPLSDTADSLGSAVPSATRSPCASPAGPITMAPVSSTPAGSTPLASISGASPMGSLTSSRAEGPPSATSVQGGGLGGALAAPSGATPVVSAGAASSQPQTAPAPPVAPPVSGQIAGRLGPTPKGSN